MKLVLSMMMQVPEVLLIDLVFMLLLLFVRITVVLLASVVPFSATALGTRRCTWMSAYCC